MPISMREIAARAGVSESTVSLVLSNKKGTRVALATQQRVRDIAREMDFRPNSFARSMARRKTNTLRLITSSHANPYYVRIAQAVDISTRRAGYKLWVDATMNERWTYGPGEDVSIWPVDGALIYSATSQDLTYFFGQQAHDIPIVYFGNIGEDLVDSVLADMYLAGRQAVEHLVLKGYRRIAYLSTGDPRAYVGADLRIMAYEDVCRETGRTVQHFHTRSQWDVSEYKLSLETGLEIAALPAGKRPHAVVCRNDVNAFGVYSAALRSGLRVPEDIAVVGFDGGAEGQCMPQALTTISMPVDAMCKAAVDLLVRRIAGDRADSPRRIVFPTELILGGTS